MISLTLARQLRDAGLAWTPAFNDFFAIPDRGLDEHIFVIGEIVVGVEQLNGQPAFSFQGAAEWALDYVLAGDAVWLPGEAQLRGALEDRLFSVESGPLTLMISSGGYRLEIPFDSQLLTFEASGASEVYAKALLHVLNHSNRHPS